MDDENETPEENQELQELARGALESGVTPDKIRAVSENVFGNAAQKAAGQPHRDPVKPPIPVRNTTPERAEAERTAERPVLPRPRTGPPEPMTVRPEKPPRDLEGMATAAIEKTVRDAIDKHLKNEQQEKIFKVSGITKEGERREATLRGKTAEAVTSTAKKSLGWKQVEVVPAPHATATPRNRVIPLASGSHLAALDDDDVWLPDALKTIREAITKDPDHPHFFRMMYWNGQLSEGYGTPCHIVPNNPAKLGRYLSYYGGDGAFWAATVRHYQDGAIVHPEALAQLRPLTPEGNACV